MHRLLTIAVLAVLTVGSAVGVSGASVTPHIASCSDSFPADGHAGPWRTATNGGTLHGNTVSIDCPSSSTHWDITYRVGIINNHGEQDIIIDHRSGNGSPPDFSESVSPFACDLVFEYRTHVDNNVTGGNANKPSGGNGVHLAC